MTDSYDFDAIVIGSGITGGWAAKELTEKGLKVLMLERGRPVTHGKDYTTEHLAPWKVPFGSLPDRETNKRDYFIQSKLFLFNTLNRHFFINDRLNPYVQAKPYYWIRANNVGGKSLTWGRQCYRWSDLDFSANKRDGHGNDWPIRYADIKDWYSYVEKFVGISGESLGLPQLPDSEFLPPMELTPAETLLKTGVESNFADRKVTIGRVAVLTKPLNGRAACHYCGPCSRGCSAGAYFSTQSSTLPAARKTGNLTLRSDSIVEGLDYDPGSKKISGVRVLDTNTKERTRYTGKLVFLCASTFGSLQILMNSRSDTYPNGLSNSSGVLGRYIMDHHHGAGATGYFSLPGKYYYGNQPNGILIPRFRNLDGQDDGIEFLRGYGYQGGSRVEEWDSTWSKIDGFGAEYKDALRKPGRWSVTINAMGETLPYRDNKVELDKKLDRFGIPQVRFEVTYRDNEFLMRKDSVKQAVKMFEAAGAEEIRINDRAPVPGLTIHEMGGARMGNDPGESVLNRFNQSHEISNLFVTDGSAMCSTSVINPSLTFMALTARAVDYAVSELKMDRI